MKRQVLKWLVILGAHLVVTAALAQDSYPNRPIQMIVPFTAGGLQDIAARVVAQKMSEHLGQPIVIENRPGAGGNIAADYVAKSPPDGYRLYWGFLGTNAANVSLYKSLAYDPIKDFQPMSLVGNAPTILIVHPSLPIHTVPELIAYGKANPRKLNFAHSGSGSPSDIFQALLASMAGMEVVAVPYKGTAPAQIDIIAGRVHGYFDAQVSGLANIRAGKVRAIGVGSPTRLSALPDVAPIADTLPGFSAYSWFGILAPAGLPLDRVNKLNAAALKALSDEATRTTFRNSGLEITPSTPDEFGRFMAAETQRLGKVIKAIGMAAE